ncbi:hypothetical protein V492_04113 [Pseudogymnoascus sp. VKM F-4246]|nr:hypothetical protein V492_04113 [Pseudogymnoascus sp. VKM F-4246]
MQLIKVAVLLAPLIAVASATVDDSHVLAKINLDDDHMSRTRNARTRSVRRLAGLEKRECDTNGCKCAKNTPQGVYCGLCEEVIESGKGGRYTRDTYECSTDGTCCSYGAANVCTGSNYASNCPRST